MTYQCHVRLYYGLQYAGLLGLRTGGKGAPVPSDFVYSSGINPAQITQITTTHSVRAAAGRPTHPGERQNAALLDCVKLVI